MVLATPCLPKVFFPRYTSTHSDYATCHTDAFSTGATKYTPTWYQSVVVITAGLSGGLREGDEGYARFRHTDTERYLFTIAKERRRKPGQPLAASTLQQARSTFTNLLHRPLRDWQQTLCVRAWLLIQKVKNIYIYIFIYICIYTDMYTYIYI